MNRPRCWICGVLGAAIALAAFACYQGNNEPIYALAPDTTVSVPAAPVNS